MAGEERPRAGGNRRDLMGYGLALLNKASKLGVLDRFGLRKPAERALYDATKVGFRTVAAASRTFTPAKGKGQPTRLPSRPSRPPMRRPPR